MKIEPILQQLLNFVALSIQDENNQQIYTKTRTISLPAQSQELNAGKSVGKYPVMLIELAN